MQINTKFSIILFFSFVSTILSAQSAYEKIESQFSNAYKGGHYNGSSIIVKNDSILYSGSFGQANEEWQIENTEETKFKIGSCTKQFTATLIMLLVEEGEINLDSSICTYLSNYPKPNGELITIHQLLSHTSGIPDYFYLPQSRQLIYKENKPLDFIKTFWNEPLSFEPGSKSKYSNSGYFILGCIIEKLTGKTYAEVLQERIFEPLGMNNSGIDNQKEIFRNKAYGYIAVDNQLQVAPYLNSSGAYSAGAIFSSCKDLYKWCQSLLDETLLNHEIISKMTTPNNSKYGYGFGVVNLDINGESLRVFGHEGEIFGFRSLIHIIPNEKTCIIILDNHNNTKLFGLSKEIMKLL